VANYNKTLNKLKILLDKFEKEIIKQTQRDLQNLHVA
jgi:hypothetical protein